MVEREEDGAIFRQGFFEGFHFIGDEADGLAAEIEATGDADDRFGDEERLAFDEGFIPDHHF